MSNRSCVGLACLCNLDYYATYGRKVCDTNHRPAKNIVAATQKIAHGIRTEIPELYILGNPPASVVAFRAKEDSGVDVLKVGDTMSRKG